MVVCLPYNSNQKEAWNSFVKSSKTPLFFFDRDFLEYHSDRFVDASMMFYIDEILVAVLPASCHEETLISHGGLTYGGLLVSEKARAETVRSALECLAEYAGKVGFKKIVLKAVPYIFHKVGAQEDLYFIVNRLNAKIFRRDLSSVIHLDCRTKLSKGRKWLIARAKKMSLEVTTSTNWVLFHALLSKVLERHGAAPVHSVEELSRLSIIFPKNIKLKVVKKDDDLLAAALLFIFDGVVHTQYLATSEQGKECGALDLLIENCISDSYNEGFKYFSFGVSTEDQGKTVNAGLIGQKESFGARGVVLDFYEIELND